MTANVHLIICNSLEHPQTDTKLYKGILKCTGTINSNRLLEGFKCLCREEEKTAECFASPEFSETSSVATYPGCNTKIIVIVPL